MMLDPTAIFHTLIIFFAFAGYLIATTIRHKKKTHEPMVCPLNADCGAVVNSRHSKFFGIPLELMGMGYYALIAVMYGLLIMIPYPAAEFVFIAMGISLAAVLMSLYLIAVQLFVLKDWCSWCMFSAVISIGIFVFSIAGLELDIVALLGKYKSFIVIVHAMAAAIGLGAATITDIFFFRYLKDYRISHFESDNLKLLSQIIWFALGLLVITGIGLFVQNSQVLQFSSKFLLKTFAVATLIGNGVLLNLIIQPTLVHISFGEDHHHHQGELPMLRKLAFASGALSIISWYLIFILGSIRSIPISFAAGLVLYVGLVVLGIAGSQLYLRYMDKKAHRHQQKG